MGSLLRCAARRRRTILYSCRQTPKIATIGRAISRMVPSDGRAGSREGVWRRPSSADLSAALSQRVPQRHLARCGAFRRSSSMSVERFAARRQHGTGRPSLILAVHAPCRQPRPEPPSKPLTSPPAAPANSTPGVARTSTTVSSHAQLHPRDGALGDAGRRLRVQVSRSAAARAVFALAAAVASPRGRWHAGTAPPTAPPLTPAAATRRSRCWWSAWTTAGRLRS